MKTISSLDNLQRATSWILKYIYILYFYFSCILFYSYLMDHFEFPSLNRAVNEKHENCKLIIFLCAIDQIITQEQDDIKISIAYRHSFLSPMMKPLSDESITHSDIHCV